MSGRSLPSRLLCGSGGSKKLMAELLGLKSTLESISHAYIQVLMRGLFLASLDFLLPRLLPKEATKS